MFKKISRVVWILSVVSLFTDVASEMLYPVMPIYLKSIGFSIMIIGILEGVAEATAGLSKGYFGKLSDAKGKRLPFVKAGYILSAIAKPMIAIFTHPVWIFFVRTTDRFAKGIRTGARDAILSEEATPETKGTVFGFHRAMDTIGAAIGPAVALVYLYFHPKDYITLFYIAFVPGAMAIITTLLLKEKKAALAPTGQKVSFFSFLKYWKQSPVAYRQLSIGLLLFTLFNSSDVFLLLKAKAAGLNDTHVIGVYIFYNIIYALFAFPVGALADKIGLKRIFLIGIGLFSVVYLGFSINTNLYVFLVLFFIYGLYASATEGVSKAWISNISDSKDTATAIGTFSALQSICTMVASSLAGIIWYSLGAKKLFIMSGVMALVVIGYLWRMKEK
ncbi:MAG: MFS transporter [Bacteroidota bacterium]|nr:MFS transporter [Bacteroidota bacterium]